MAKSAKIKEDNRYGFVVYVTGSNEPRAVLNTYDQAVAWCDKRGIEVNRAAYTAETRRVSMVEHVMFGSAR